MNDQISAKVWIGVGLLAFLFLILAGVGSILWVRGDQSNDYPFGTTVEGVSRCGEIDWFQRGKSVRVERYRCVVTDDSAGDVVLWYIKQGYTPRNGGMVSEFGNDGLFARLEIERIYPIEQKDGTVMVRIYDDTIVRAPLP